MCDANIDNQILEKFKYLSIARWMCNQLTELNFSISFH